MKSNEGDNAESKVRFRREIGLLEGTSITLGAIIGSGIFISPKGIVAQVGSVGLSLVIWVVSGVWAIIGASCYTELGTAFPNSGGDYIYLHEAFGPVPAFMLLWANIVIFMPCHHAILSLAFAQYILQPLFSIECGGEIPDMAVRMLAAVAIISLTFLNCYDANGAAKIQNVFSFTKLAALGLVIVTGLVTVLNGNTNNFTNPFENSTTDPGKIALALYSGVYAYDGAYALNTMVEEVKSPSKTLPRSIYISVSVIITVYLLTNAAYFSTLTPAEMIHSNAVAVTFGEKTLGQFSWIISLFVAMSTLGGLAVSTMMSSRVIFVGARRGQFPKVLAHLQATRMTPVPAVVFLGLLSLTYLCTSDIYSLINYSGFMWSVVGVGMASSVLQLRRIKPNQPRPVKIHLIYPILYLIISIFLLIVPIYAAPLEALFGALITLSGIPVYFLLVRRPPSSNKNSRFITLFLQKIFISLPEE